MLSYLHVGHAYLQLNHKTVDTGTSSLQQVVHIILQTLLQLKRQFYSSAMIDTLPSPPVILAHCDKCPGIQIVSLCHCSVSTFPQHITKTNILTCLVFTAGVHCCKLNHTLLCSRYVLQLIIEILAHDDITKTSLTGEENMSSQMMRQMGDHQEVRGKVSGA